MRIQVNLFDQESQNHVVNQNKVSIGRSSQCDVIINHESMSRKHCLIEIENGKIYVTDLKSTNGVSIDGVKIAPNEKTFYLNSLPLMVGGANVIIDLTDHQTQMIDLSKKNNQEIKKVSSTEGKTATTETKKISKEITSSLELDIKPTKSKTTKKIKSVQKIEPGKKKEILVASIAVLIFALLALWHFSQN